MSDDFDIFGLEDLEDTDENEKFEFECLPAGEYLCEILEVDKKEGSTEKGEYYQAVITYQVKDEPHSGARIWHRIFTKHTGNARCESLGKAQLKRIYLNTGVKTFTELVGKLVLVKTKIKEYNGNKSPDVIDVYPASKVVTKPTTPATDDDGIPEFMK